MENARKMSSSLSEESEAGEGRGGTIGSMGSFLPPREQAMTWEELCMRAGQSGEVKKSIQ